VDVALVLPAAVDVDPLHGFEVGAVLLNQVDRVVLASFAPARGEGFTGVEVEEDGEALVSDAVVLRRQPDAEFAQVRVAERVAAQDLRVVLEDEEVAGRSAGALEHRRMLKAKPGFPRSRE